MADVPDAAVVQPNLSLVLERITDGFFALDAQWRIAYMNAEARKLLHGPANPIGRYWLDVFPKARGRLFEREYTRAMREQHPVQFVEYSKTANCWFEVKAYPSSDGISVYFRDVSARIEAQREVERNAQRLEALVDFGRTAISDGGCARTVAAAIELVRDALETPIVEVHTFDPARERFVARDVAGWPSNAVFSPLAPIEAHLLYAVRTREPFVSSDLRIDPRARSVAALASCGAISCIVAPIESANRMAGAIVAYDVKPRTFSVGDVRFMESVAQTLAESNASYESNRRTEQVLESIGDAFCAVDRDLRITYVNGRMARFWKTSQAEIAGRPLALYTREFDAEGKILRLFKDALAHARSHSYETELRGRAYEGRIYPFSDGVAVYVRDITRRRRDDARVRNLNAELLRAIDGLSKALTGDFDERAGSHVDRLRDAAQRMADLIDAQNQVDSM
jgi:PAS domain S-box-containing protein